MNERGCAGATVQVNNTPPRSDGYMQMLQPERDISNEKLPTFHTTTSDSSSDVESLDALELETAVRRELILPAPYLILSFVDLFFWAIIITTFLVLLGVLVLSSRTDSRDLFACDATGKARFTFPANPWSVWNAKSTFNITIGVRGLSFSVAKLLDICWDLLVGRFGQVVLAVVLYRTFRPATVILLKSNGVSHEQLLAMQYSPTSFWALCTFVKSSFTRRQQPTPPGSIEKATHSTYRQSNDTRPVSTLSPSLYAVTLIFSTIYLLIFPTWLSAMTAYQAPTHPVLPQEGGMSVSFFELVPCGAVIIDGHRIGLEDYACISRTNPLFITLKSYAIDHPNSTITYHDTPFGNMTSMTVREREFRFGDKYWPLSDPGLTLYRSPYGLYWSFRGRAYSLSELMDAGQCQAQQSYEWGFSFLLLFTFLLTSLPLACLMYAMRLKVWRIQISLRKQPAHARGEDQVFGDIITAMKVAASIWEHLPREDAERCTDSEMKKGLRSRSKWMMYPRSVLEPG